MRTVWEAVQNNGAKIHHVRPSQAVTKSWGNAIAGPTLSRQPNSSRQSDGSHEAFTSCTPLSPDPIVVRSGREHGKELAGPGVADPLSQVLGAQKTGIGRDAPYPALPFEQIPQLFLGVGLALEACHIPEIIEMASAGPPLLLLDQGTHLLGDDLDLGVGRDRERLDAGPRGRDNVPLGTREQRLIEREVDLDRRQSMRAGPAAGVFNRDLNLSVVTCSERILASQRNAGFFRDGCGYSGEEGERFLQVRSEASEINILREPVSGVVAMTEACPALENPWSFGSEGPREGGEYQENDEVLLGLVET